MVLSVVAKGAANAARNVASRQSMRALSTSAAVKKDLIQEAYLRELKAYKAPAKSADAHKGQVREFHQPQPPKAPQVPSTSDMGKELNDFSASEPDHAEHIASSSEAASAGPRQDVNAFLEEARKPIEPEHH